METLSTGAYYLSLERCESINDSATAEALTSLERECNCSRNEDPVTPLREVTDFLLNPHRKLEDRFFNVLGNEHAKDLRCTARKVEEANASEDIAKKLPLLKNLRKSMQQAIKTLASPEVIGKTCPLSLDDLRRDHSPSTNAPYFNTCTKLIQSRLGYEAVIQSIPGSGLQDFRRFLDQESLNDNSDDATRRISQASLKASVQLRELARDFKAPDARTQRRHLMSDPGLIQRLVDASSDKKAMTALACQSDGRYGKGADRLDLGLDVGSVVLTGGAALTARAGTLAAQILRGTSAARAQGLVSARAAKVLQLSAFAADSLSAYSGLESECLNGRNATRAKISESACSESSRQTELSETNCILAKTLAMLQFGGLATTIAMKPKTRVMAIVESSGSPPPVPRNTDTATAAPTTLRGNEKMAEEVRRRQTARPWPERARELAKQAVEKRISELELPIPFAVRRRPPDPELIANVEKQLAEKLNSQTVIRVRGVDKEIDEWMQGELFEAMLDREKVVKFLADDARTHLSRTVDYLSRAQLDRHIAQIEDGLRRSADDAIDTWREKGSRHWDDLVAESREAATGVLDYHGMVRNERAAEKAAERRENALSERAAENFLKEQNTQLQRFKDGNPSSAEKADYRIWSLIGKPEINGRIHREPIERYRKIMTSSWPAKKKAERLVKEELISQDSAFYRELAHGWDPTAVRLPRQDGLPKGYIHTPSDVASSCPQCPSRIRFSIDPHFDVHIWQRASEFGRQTMPETAVPAIAALGKLPKGTPTSQIADLEKLKSFMTEVQRDFSRERDLTTMWSIDKRNWFLENLNRVKWDAPVTSNRSDNHVLLSGELNGTKVTMAICVRSPCSHGHIKPGDVASIWPKCGPGVFNIPRSEHIGRAITALSEPTLNNNGDFRRGLIVEELCK